MLRKLMVLLLALCLAMPAVGNADAALEVEEVVPLVRTMLNGTYSYRFEERIWIPMTFQFRQSMEQIKAVDGSMFYGVDVHVYIPGVMDDSTESMKFYYCNEGDQYTCYVDNGYDPVKTVMTLMQFADMQTDGLLITGGQALLPAAMKDVQLTMVDDGYELSYRITCREGASCQAMLVEYLTNLKSFSGHDIPDDTPIRCVLRLTPQLQPVSMTYDFTDVKALIYSDGDLSAEYAFGIDLLMMRIAFSSDIPDTIQVPDDVLLNAVEISD